MTKLLLALLGVVAAAVLLVPALAGGGEDGRKVLDANVLAPVSEPYTGSTNAIRGVPGGGLPWEIDRGSADLRASGRLRVSVDGLVLARRDPVPESLQGTNPIQQFKAIVSCLSTSEGVATTENVSTAPVTASTSGDAEIDETVALPSPCFAPIVFVTSAGGMWFAVTGR